MNRLWHRIASIAPILACGCASARRIDYATFVASDEALPAAPQASAGKTTSEVEAALAREASLPTILLIALARNPDTLELRARVHAAVDRVPTAGRLPDLQLKYEQWGVPLKRPYA